MTDWKYELTETAIVVITVAFLIFFDGKFEISLAIFFIGTVFSLYNASIRKAREFEIQWHWLIIAILSGALFVFKFRYYALLFVTVYSLIRLALSLIRREEISELDEEIEKIRAEYEEKISLIRRQCSGKLKIAAEEFQIEKLRESLTLRADFQKKLSDARAKFEKLKEEEIRQIEESYRQRQIELEKIAAGKNFNDNSGEEKNKIISELKKEYDAKISDMSKQIEIVSAELEKKRREIDAINKEHEINLKKLAENIERKHQSEIEKLQQDNRYNFEDYQSKLAAIRAESEKDTEQKIREIESDCERKILALQKILAENKTAFAEEKNNLEREKDRTIKELRDKSKSNEKIVSDLQNRIAEQDTEIKKLESRSDRSQNKIFCNGELHNLLLETLRNAKTEVDIMSPWLNWKIKEKLNPLLKKLLERGVVLKIAYGINNDNYADGATRNDKTGDVIGNLQKQFGGFKNFHTKKISSHGKIFICDDSYYVLTSMNPLSNKGDLWTEIGEKSWNKENLKKYREKYFDFRDHS